ncbi:aldo/keto reductase [Streptomyces sp. NPDC126522]|uniref:aldo/keto reductase n=1 Tax=Streptomyces sp. NPDC126522 TaxID=3155211 RepID=UPI00331C03DA
MPLRDELRSNRDELVIGTKGGLRRTDTGVTRDAGPCALREGVDASLTALYVDHIDLYQVHCDPKEIDSIMAAVTPVVGPSPESMC